MAKKSSHKRKQASGRKSGAGKTSASLKSEVRRLSAAAASAREQAGSVKKKFARVYETIMSTEDTAHAVHQDIRVAEAHVTDAEKQTGTVSRKMTKPFIIVGVGASAGGFEAFSQLLEKVSPETGMAFVLVQHLDPTHESKLSELLGQSTKMPVVEVRPETPVEPNHVYTIPPGRSLTISQGVLRLKPRPRGNGPHLPVDEFLQSLATDQGNRAVGVILSGNGVDGTLGLKQIKAEGGITFAQDELSAKFHGMPGSALHSGCVDFVLAPPAIAKELERISRYSPLRRQKIASAEPVLPGTETELVKIFGLLRALTGVDFSYYKLTTLKRRITRRMVLKKIENLREYLKFLQQNPEEVDLLFNDILINVTGFFRDAHAFASLKKKVFPRILKQKAGSPIRVWVPGCSTGEEVYSLAICLHEFLGKNVNAKAMQIFGTDISDTMVGRARLGLYPESISSQVSPERLRRYFTKTDHGYQISKFIRDVCIFAKQNVAEDPPFSKLDLISCRNLLIYLGPVLQKKVMPIFHYSLQPGGYLMLGSSETIGTFSNLFTLADKKNKIYSKLETQSRPEMEFFPSHAAEVDDPRPLPAKEEISRFDLQRRADEILLSQYTPGGAVVNARLEVLHFRGKTGYYLEPAPGTASLNLLKMVREELAVDLRTAFAQAAKTNLPVRKDPVRIRYNGHYREVTLEVVPFKNTFSSERYFLVLFHDFLGVLEVEKSGHGKARTLHQHAQREIRRLREEIGQTKESLQTIIEEQEATNEELKSANEEIQSSNEELQSTNEELETAKEELQSTNEELTTLNEELQNRNSELSQANNDLSNLIGSFNMQMLMLGNDLTIRRFTPLAEKLFNLIPGDVGRRISDINSNIDLPHLDRIVSEVIDSLNMREIEVQDREGRWFSIRIRPYRTSENKIEGAVIVLVDIGDVRHAIDEITELSAHPMLILNDEFKVTKANQKFYHQFSAERAETEGKSIFETSNGRWNVPAFRNLLERILPENKRVENYKVELELSKSRRRTLQISARRLYPQNKGTHYSVLRFEEAL